jgi:ABC-type transport system involved in multi-copper enzyme maturation permease subunit
MASTVAEAPLAQLTAVPANAGNANLVGALKSEFTKIRSVRSTYWNLLGMMVVTIGFGALAGYGATRNPHSPGFDPTMHSLGGLYLGQLIIAALGVIVITSEYSTKMIGTSLTAMPRRGTFIAAKAIVFGVIALVTGLIASFAAFFVGQAIMSSHHINATLSQPGVLRAVVGGALFLTAVGLLGFGIGLLIRHTAGAISAAVALLFVASILVNLLPQNWQNHVDRLLPAIAGGYLWSVVPQQGPPATFGPWTGFAVLCGWAVVAIAGGMYLFRRRNA